MTDYKKLCAELHAAFTTYAVDECHHNLLERTRAALADGPSSVVSEPSDEEIMELWYGSDWYNKGATLREFLSIARAVLARWGNLLPVPPADGEVAELISKLQKLCADLDYDDRGDDAGCCYRAAELLQRQAPVPVSVSERLPGPEDCDAEGKCWWFHDEDNASCSHWLPANALPLPQGEVEP